MVGWILEVLDAVEQPNNPVAHRSYQGVACVLKVTVAGKRERWAARSIKQFIVNSAYISLESLTNY